MADRANHQVSPHELERLDQRLKDINRRYDAAMQGLKRFNDGAIVSEEHLYLSVVIEAYGLKARIRIRPRFGSFDRELMSTTERQ